MLGLPPSLFLFALSASAAAVPQSLSVTFDQTKAASSAVPLSSNVAAISIEFCYILDYFGDVGKPNTLTKQLLQNIEDRVGKPPPIRLGGHTQDVARFCGNCTQALTNVFSPGNDEAVNVTFGEGLFKVLMENVSPRQQYIFGINFGQNDVQFPLAEVAAVEASPLRSQILSYELGNEPDFYGSQRLSGWNVQTYVTQQEDWWAQINSAVSAGRHRPVPAKQLGAFAQAPVWMGNFSIAGTVKLGLPQTVGNVKTASDHTYPFSICDAGRAAQVSLPNLMNHTRNMQYFTQWEPEIAAAKSVGVGFTMGETGSVSCHGKEGVSNTLGAALWEIDYVLHGVVMGMEGVYFHAGTPFFYSMWQPVPHNTTPEGVWPTYYSLLFLADLVANVPSAKVYQVTELESDYLALYAVYSGKKLSKLAALNLNFYNNTSVARPSQKLDVSKLLGRDVTVKRFTGATSDVTGGVTWAGQSFDKGAAEGKMKVERVKNGVVEVLASEGVIIERR